MSEVPARRVQQSEAVPTQDQSVLTNSHFLLREAVSHEVPVEVAAPLDVDGHHPTRDGELGVVPASSLHHLS